MQFSYFRRNCNQSGRRKCHGSEYAHRHCYKEACHYADNAGNSAPKIPEKPNRVKESGTWTEWTEWSSCSRTCKGGLTYITRKCLTDGKYGNPTCNVCQGQDIFGMQTGLPPKLTECFTNIKLYTTKKIITFIMYFLQFVYFIHVEKSFLPKVVAKLYQCL